MNKGRSRVVRRLKRIVIVSIVELIVANDAGVNREMLVPWWTRLRALS